MTQLAVVHGQGYALSRVCLRFIVRRRVFVEYFSYEDSYG